MTFVTARLALQADVVFKMTVAETQVTAPGRLAGFNAPMKPGEIEVDFNERPYIAIWEVTQACDLAWVHCRACAQPKHHHPLDLSTEEGKRLIDPIEARPVPVFVLTGGGPIKRPDLFESVEYANKVGIGVSLMSSATPLLTCDIVHRLKEWRLAPWRSASMDRIKKCTMHSVACPDRWTDMEVIEWANEVGLPVQISTTFSRTNHADFEAVAALLARKRISRWSVFFLAPTGRGKLDQLLTTAS